MIFRVNKNNNDVYLGWDSGPILSSFCCKKIRKAICKGEFDPLKDIFNLK